MRFTQRAESTLAYVDLFLLVPINSVVMKAVKELSSP
jgi:hypothetical protein